VAWWGGGGSFVVKWNCDSVLIWLALKLKGTEGRRFRGRCTEKIIQVDVSAILIRYDTFPRSSWQWKMLSEYV
jgi:hypothetical protein